MADLRKEAEVLSGLFAEVYYLCHPAYTVPLTHQGVRALHFVAMSGAEGRTVTVGGVAAHLGLAHNSASELLKRLREKGLVAVRRGEVDERVVEVRLTDEGERALGEHVGLDVERLGEALAAMSARERKAVRSAFGVLAGRLRAGSMAGSAEVILLVAKAAVSGLVIVAANVIADRLSPSLGGWVAAFPLISFLTVAWLWFDGGSGSEATGLLVGVLWGLIPTAVLLLSVVVMTRNGLPLVVSMLLGTAIWFLFTLAAEKSGIFGT